jgi:hypothetical protein
MVGLKLVREPRAGILESEKGTRCAPGQNVVSAASDLAGPQRCLNCNSSVDHPHSYCGECGQCVRRKRLTMRDIGHDLVHAFTHADHSILSLVRDLAIRPGHVAREYVDGRRKKHFGPFVFLFISVGLASFAIVTLGVRWFSDIDDHSAASFLQRHVNLVILMQAPILAGLCRMFFRTAGLNYAENLVLVAYASGFRCLLLALVGTPLMFLTHAASADRLILIGYYLIWVLYLAYAAVPFFRGPTWWTAGKAAAAAILTQLIAIYAIYGFIWVWARVFH